MMAMSDLLQKYKAAFVEAFELEDGASFETLEYQSIDEWDSIGHMALMAELEEQFSISIKTEDLVQFESYRQGVEILKRYNVVIDLS